jgi:DegV family protein with EDD domain
MRIRVITDSAADIPFEFVKKYDIGTVPHSVNFEDQDWKIGIGISVKEYYKKLRKMDEIPKNAAPTPQDFDIIFRESLEEKKYEHILYIAISEKLSSTANTARIASKKYKGKITIFNTEAASVVQGLLLLHAIKLLRENKNIEEIISQLIKLREDYILDVGFFTLEYAYKSGRVNSKFVFYLTKFIGIKPIAVMERPGIMISKFPAFFTKSNMEKRLAKIIAKKAKKGTIYNLLVSNVENLTGAERVSKLIQKKIKIKESYITDSSPIVGTNTGEGTIIAGIVPAGLENI